MRRPRKNLPERHQPTPDALLAELLDFLQRKFYEGHAVNFTKDRRRLLDWVVLWPAKWLNERGVTLPAERYREIFFTVFMDGLVFGNVGQITYLPAWLAKVIQSHFQHHGDEIYQEAKSMRSMVEETMILTGKLAVRKADPVNTLAQAAALLRQPKKRSKIRPQKAQLSLL